VKREAPGLVKAEAHVRDGFSDAGKKGERRGDILERKGYSVNGSYLGGGGGGGGGRKFMLEKSNSRRK